MDRLLDWRLRHVLRKSGIPDLPEVRRMMRLAWWNGFTSGALEDKAAQAREEGLEAIRNYWSQVCPLCGKHDDDCSNLACLREG